MKKSKVVIQGTLLSAVIVLFSACGNSHLKPEDAQKMISERYHLPKIMTWPVQNGTIRFINGSGLSETKKLADAGIFICEELQASDGYDRGVYQVNITPAGAKIKIKDTTDNEGRNYHIFKTSDKVFGTISEIRHSEDGASANVSYSIEYINTNPVFDVFGVREKRKRVKANGEGKYVVTRQARFQKNDEGLWVMLENQKSAKDYMDDMQTKTLRRSSNSIATDDPNDIEY